MGKGGPLSDGSSGPRRLCLTAGASAARPCRSYQREARTTRPSRDSSKRMLGRERGASGSPHRCIAIRSASRLLDASRAVLHCGPPCVAICGASRSLVHRDPGCVATMRKPLAAHAPAMHRGSSSLCDRKGRAAVRRLVGPQTPLPNGSEFCCRTRRVGKSEALPDATEQPPRTAAIPC
jgi:hypothetical protein